jgi:hypothetical protein
LICNHHSNILLVVGQGGAVRKLGRYFLNSVLGLLLVGCAASETRSIVSSEDIPSGKYRKVIVFIEHNNEKERAALERAVILAIQGAGVAVGSGTALFAGKRLSDEVKARIVQKDFNAVLYVNVLVNGMREQLVEYARHDGQFITIDGRTEEIDHYAQTMYNLKEDGSVYKLMPTLHTRSDLQDTKTNKQVWAAETIASGGTLTLYSQASKQIVQRLRADGAI